MTKPMVFNYADHERALEEIKKLKEDIANLQIRCRIAESETHAEHTANARETHEHKSKLYGKHAGAIFIDEPYEDGDRNCEQCKHHKADGCSRWNCEYEPRMDGLISRQDAIDAIERNAYRHTYLNQIIDIIESLPSADRPTGEWIYAKEQLEIVPMWECSCCRTRISKKFNYCPNCGARMYKGGDSE